MRKIRQILPLYMSLCILVSISSSAFGQTDPQTQFQEAVGLFDRKLYPEARAAFTAILQVYDNPENRANIEFDSILGGSHYYIGETYFQEDKHAEAAPYYQEVIASFTSFKPESIYHLGLGKYYRQDHEGAIATLGQLVQSYPSSPLAPQAIYYQAVCKELSGDKSGARSYYRELLEKYPDHPWSKKALEKAAEQ